ncbi:MAG: DUF2341 domain-containing protein [Bacteroidia bacterium]
MDQNDIPKNRLTQRLGTRITHRKEVAGTVAVFMAAIFLTVSLGGSGNLPGYKWRQELSIDGSKISGVPYFSGYPVYVKIAAPHLRQKDQGGKVETRQGNDIRFTRSDGATQLPVFIENYNSGKGELTAWVILDTVFAGRKTSFFMYYGNPDEKNTVAEMVESEQLRGYFLDKKMEESGRSVTYSPAWLETEAYNHSHPEEFVILGEEEYMNKPIAVDFVYLKAELKASNMVLVEWGTRGENDNESFFIEKSRDGIFYQALDKMAGGRRTRAELGYSYSDAAPESGKNYYRIKQLTNTGDFSYTRTLLVHFNPQASGLEVLSVEPVNFKDDVRIFMRSDAPEEVKIQFFTENGELIWEGKTQNGSGENQFALPGAGAYPSGRYVLGISGQNRKLKTYLLTKEK